MDDVARGELVHAHELGAIVRDAPVDDVTRVELVHAHELGVGAPVARDRYDRPPEARSKAHHLSLKWQNGSPILF